MEKRLKFLIILLSLLFIALISTIACASFTDDSEISDILVIPADTSILLDGTQQYKAIAAYVDGSTSDITDRVVWGSSSADVANIDTLGRARAKSTGVTQISASLDGVQRSTSLVIAEAVPFGAPPIPDGHAPSNCDACHATGIGGAPQWPSSPKHVAAWNCKSCHQSGSIEITIASIPTPHPADNCATCHATGILGVPQWPSTHFALDLDCRKCHSTATGGSTLPDIPKFHPKEDCATCHSIGSLGVPRWPATHTEQWPCQNCHVKSTSGTTPPSIPSGHAVVNCSSCHTDRTPADCYLCHSAGKMEAPQWPAGHVQNWPCKSCHQQG